MLEESAALQLDADDLFNGARVFANVDTAHSHFAAVGIAHTLDDFYGGGFSRAVGSQECEHLTFAHVE